VTGILALIVAWLFPLGFLYGVRALDLYRTGKFQYNILSLLWGSAAYGLAVLLNSLLLQNTEITRDQAIQYAAPVLEELLKAGILFYLVRRPDFNYVVDGAIYGFGAGMGFAIVENTEYVLGSTGVALVLALSRVFSTNLIHASGSGLIGTALAAARDERRWRGAATAAAGIVIAIALHVGFNSMVNSGWLLVFAIAAGMFGAALIVTAIRKGLAVQKVWIEEKLGATDRVTRGEAQVVGKLADLDNVLAPLVERFGAEKAVTVEEFLLLQAKIGIKRKLHERSADAERKREIETEISQLRSEMELARKKAGTYCMLFVRGIFPEARSPVWGLIQNRIEQANLGNAGGGLWDLASSRIKTSESGGREA